MKKKFAVWLSIFLSIGWLTFPSRGESVFETTGRASQSQELPIVREVDVSLLHERVQQENDAEAVRRWEAVVHWNAVVEWNRVVAENERKARIEAARKQAEEVSRSRRIVRPGSAGDKIAACEGGLAYLHKDHGPTSTASGKYGFLDGTWDGLDGVKENGFKGYSRAMYAPESVQDEGFAILWNGGKGAGHWAASKHCHGLG